MPDTSTVVPAPTGLDEIDREHALLASMLASLTRICPLIGQGRADCMPCGTDRICACRSARNEAITHLFDYLVAHFAHEERLIRQLPWSPERARHLEAHAEAHGDLSARVADIASRHDMDVQAHLRGLADTVRHWMESHIRDFDRPLVALLREAAAEECATTPH